MRAAGHNRKEMFVALLEAGADYTLKNYVSIL